MDFASHISTDSEMINVATSRQQRRQEIRANAVAEDADDLTIANNYCCAANFKQQIGMVVNELVLVGRQINSLRRSGLC